MEELNEMLEKFARDINKIWDGIKEKISSLITRVLTAGKKERTKKQARHGWAKIQDARKHSQITPRRLNGWRACKNVSMERW